MTKEEVRLILDALTKLAEATAERLRDHDKEISELRAEIERLKAEPRMTVAQRARARGQA